MKSRLRTRSSSKKNGRRVIYLCLGVVWLGLLATLYVWQRMEAIRLVKEIGQLEKQISQQEKAKQYLEIQVAGLSSPEQISRLAEQRFGFRATQITQLVSLSDPVPGSSFQNWQRLLAELEQYSKKAWNLAEPEASAQEKHE